MQLPSGPEKGLDCAMHWPAVRRKLILSGGRGVCGPGMTRRRRRGTGGTLSLPWHLLLLTQGFSFVGGTGLSEALVSSLSSTELIG